MEKIKVTRKKYDELVKNEIKRLKMQEKSLNNNNSNILNIQNAGRIYRSIGTLGGG